MDNNAQVQAVIERLERRRLDSDQPPALPIWGQLDATRFVRVDGLAAFWKEDEECRYEQYMEDLITGCHGQGLTFAYLVLGRRNAVQVYVGMQGPQVEAILGTALRGAFPAVELAEGAFDKVGSSAQWDVAFQPSGPADRRTDPQDRGAPRSARVGCSRSSGCCAACTARNGATWCWAGPWNRPPSFSWPIAGWRKSGTSRGW